MLSMGMWFHKDHKKFSDHVIGQQIWSFKMKRSAKKLKKMITYRLKNQNDLELCKREHVEEDEDANVDFKRSSPRRENSDGDILDRPSSLRHHFDQEGIGMNHP